MTDYADGRQRILGLLTSDAIRFVYVRTTLSRCHYASICLKHLSRDLTAFSSRSAPSTRARFPAVLKGTRVIRPRPVCSFVPAALPVQTVRFLDLGYFVSQLRDAIFDVVLPDN